MKPQMHADKKRLSACICVHLRFQRLFLSACYGVRNTGCVQAASPLDAVTRART
jgi:hypothetical protein